ncbi:MAG: PTS sugar transporter subunit IIA [Isosphaeraceae bacterium]
MVLGSSLQCVLLFDDTRVTTRDQAIESMLARLAADGFVPSQLVDELQDSIARREELGPTGIGEGVAIPHAWHRGLERMASALAVSRQGLEYPSLDGQPVHIVLLVLTPPSAEFEPAKGKLLDRWLRHLREPAFRASLTMAANEQELHATIHAVEQTQI